MVAKIIIKRRFVKENTPQIISLLNKIRSIAMNQRGYISGETLMQSDYPENMAVICSWQRMADWHAWKNSEERKTYEAMLEIYQTRPTQYEEYLLGTAFHDEHHLDKQHDSNE
jgi:heme-degrading monooxygenase HmoA